MNENDVIRWLEEDGQTFLKDIGINKGQAVVDFGCGARHYTIPAAKTVGQEGTVYTLDKQQNVLDRLIQIATAENLHNIIPMNTLGDDGYTQGHILNFRKIREKGNILS